MSSPKGGVSEYVFGVGHRLYINHVIAEKIAGVIQLSGDLVCFFILTQTL